MTSLIINERKMNKDKRPLWPPPLTAVAAIERDGKFPNPPPPVARRYELILPCMCCQALHYIYIALPCLIELVSYIKLATVIIVEFFPFHCEKCGQTNYASYYVDWLAGEDIGAFGMACKTLMLARTLSEDDAKKIIEQVRSRYRKKDEDI